MSDDERKGDDEIDLKDLKEEIDMVRGWSTRNFTGIGINTESIRAIRSRVEQLEAGRRGTRTHSRRGNIRGRPAIPRVVGGRRTRRRRRKRTHGKLRDKSRRKKKTKKRRKKRRRKKRTKRRK